MSEPLLRVSQLTKCYGSVMAVRGLSFEARAGCIHGLLGPNGAGKTTVLRCIAGIIQPTHGRIEIAGADLATAELAAKRALGFVPEVPNPYDLLTVWEHLEFVSRAFGQMDGLAAGGASLLERLGLTDKRDELVMTLSKGMKQKLMIACALVHDPRVLMLDEPLVGIDPLGQREVKALLQEARTEGRAVLISTHILSTAEELCDEVLILNHGDLVAAGAPAELRRAADPEQQRTLEDIFVELTSPEATDGAAAPA